MMNTSGAAMWLTGYYNGSPSVQTTDWMQNSTPTPEEDIWLKEVLFDIRMCFLPIVVAGTITNVFNFIILSQRDMKCLSTGVYLFALALADLGVMYFELFRVWFEWTNMVDPAIYFTDTYCKIANYTNGVVRDFSNWLIACLALERLVMVACPYRAKTFCTVRKAKVITVCLFFAICLPHLHSVVFSVAQKRAWWVCWEDPDSPAGAILAAVVEFCVGYVVVLVVFVLNLTLVALICRNKRPLLSGSCKAIGNRASTNRRLTRTLVFVAFVFVIGETPRIIMSFVCRFLQRTAVRRIILNIAFVISGINHACNFFIYIMSSPRFRHHLLRTFPFTYIAMARVSRNRKPPPIVRHIPHRSLDTYATLLNVANNVNGDPLGAHIDQVVAMATEGHGVTLSSDGQMRQPYYSPGASPITDSQDEVACIPVHEIVERAGPVFLSVPI